MTKRQISATEEGELNTPEFDDEIDDRPMHLPLTIGPIRRHPLPFSSPPKDVDDAKQEVADTPGKNPENSVISEMESIDPYDVGQESLEADEDLEGDFSDSEIHDMIEGNGVDQPEAVSGAPPSKRRHFAIVGDKLVSGPNFNVTKYVLDEFPDPSVLPTDWVKINHESGMPVYFHKRTRVATLSKPFCVGKYPVRLRHIPLSSIPCLKQQRDLNAVKEAAGKKEAVAFDHRNLQHSEVREYCKKLFKINELTIGRWTSWRNRRQYEKLMHRMNNDAENPELSNVKIIGSKIDGGNMTQKPNFEKSSVVSENSARKEADPEDGEINDESVAEPDTEQFQSQEKSNSNSALISSGAATYIRIPQVNAKNGDLKAACSAATSHPPGNLLPGKGRKQYLRVDGKPANAVLNEFTVLSTGDYPQYEDVLLPECERSGEFCCVVKINGIIYGIGRGRNKKLAKLEAAQEALRALIPGWKQPSTTIKTNGSNKVPVTNNLEGSSERDPLLHSVSVFDTVPVENPNITDMCQQLGLPTPYKILQTCLLRNFGLGDTELNCSVEQLSTEEVAKPGQGNQHHQHKLDKVVKLTVGERSAEVRAVSAKQGKHLAAQALLKQMHPHITNWASILRLYLRGPDVNLTSTAALQRDTTVHEMAVQKKSSSEILAKLRDEMRKLVGQPNPPSMPPSFGGSLESRAKPGDLFSLTSSS